MSCIPYINKLIKEAIMIDEYNDIDPVEVEDDDNDDVTREIEEIENAGKHHKKLKELPPEFEPIEEIPVKKNYYINPANMRAEFDACLKKGECSNKLVSMFEQIARHFSRNFMYVNQTDREACINFAVAEAWQKWNRFDPNISSNIFALFTTMISNDMRQHFKGITKNYSKNISIEALLSSTKDK